MDERFDFESLLPRALTDANLLQFRKTLEQAESWAPDFSSRYRRSRLRLLNDPWGWCRRRARPLWQKTLQSAACVLLACAVALGSLMAVSPAVRAAVRNWLRELASDGVVYRPAQQGESGLQPSWRPGWLPEGWTVTDLVAAENQISWMFQRSFPELGYTGRLSCSCYTVSVSSVGSHADTQWTYETTTIQGAPADYCKNEFNHMLVWEGENGSLFLVSAGAEAVDRAALERIAESMTYYDKAAVRYDAGWTPESLEEINRWEQIGVGQIEWVVRKDFLTFQYMTDPPAPLAEPERAWEAAEVNGLPARFWPSLVSEEQQGGIVTGEAGGAKITAGVQYGTHDSAVLMWENAETNTVFVLRGVLAREEMLQIAKSVTETPAS